MAAQTSRQPRTDKNMHLAERRGNICLSDVTKSSADEVDNLANETVYPSEAKQTAVETKTRSNREFPIRRYFKLQ